MAPAKLSISYEQQERTDKFSYGRINKVIFANNYIEHIFHYANSDRFTHTYDL